MTTMTVLKYKNAAIETKKYTNYGTDYIMTKIVIPYKLSSVRVYFVWKYE